MENVIIATAPRLEATVVNNSSVRKIARATPDTESRLASPGKGVIRYPFGKVAFV